MLSLSNIELISLHPKIKRKEKVFKWLVFLRKKRLKNGNGILDFQQEFSIFFQSKLKLTETETVTSMN